MLTEENNKCPLDNRPVLPGLDTTKNRPPPGPESQGLAVEITTAGVLEEVKRKSRPPNFSIAGTAVSLNHAEQRRNDIQNLRVAIAP